ncbi:MAG: hypothetical protein E7391_08095 [Ruminococcaceae bacterium]|nr:hypothetical protein [Oscillospiraceae bacterium]
MKIKKTIFIAVCVLILIIAFFFLFKGIIEYLNPSSFTTANLYFSNKEKTDLKVEMRKVKNNDNELKFYENLIKELLNGPTDSSLSNIIPKGTKLISLQKSDEKVTINLSSHYHFSKNTDNILARHSIAKTLFEFEKISAVEILVEGKKLTDSSGKDISLIEKSKQVTGVSGTDAQIINIITYFTNADGMYLVPEVRQVKLTENSLEKAIINELIDGPQNSDYLPVIPQGTKLLSVETKEKICFVNFSKEFITKSVGGSTGESMTVYAIVNSLTELDNIDKVQFMVEGNKIDNNSHFDFYEPIERDESWNIQ